LALTSRCWAGCTKTQRVVLVNAANQIFELGDFSWRQMFGLTNEGGDGA